MTTQDTEQELQHVYDQGAIWRYFHVMLNAEDDDLDPYQYRLIGHYRRVCGVSGHCDETIGETARKTRMGINKARETRAWLADNGYIILDRVSEFEVNVTLKDRMLENVTRYQQKPIKPKAAPVKTGKQKQGGLTDESGGGSYGSVRGGLTDESGFSNNNNNHKESSKESKLGNDLSLVDSFAETSSAPKATPSKQPTSNATGNKVSTPPISPISADLAASISTRFTKGRYYAFNEQTGRVCIKTYTAKEATAKAPELATYGYTIIKGSELNTRPDAESLVLVYNSSTSTLFDIFAEYSFGIKQGQGVSKSVGARIGSIINDFAELLVRTRNEVEHDSGLVKQVKACFERYRTTKPSGFDMPNTGPSFIKWWNRYQDLEASPLTTASATSGFKMN